MALRHFKFGKIFPIGIGYNSVYYDNLLWLKNYKMVFTMKYHVNNNTQMNLKVMKDLGVDDKRISNKYKLIGFDITYDILERLM